CLTRGTVVIRSHVNVDATMGIRGVEALLDLREWWHDRLQLQVVALLTSARARNLATARAWGCRQRSRQVLMSWAAHPRWPMIHQPSWISSSIPLHATAGASTSISMSISTLAAIT